MVPNFINPCIFKETISGNTPENGLLSLYPKQDGVLYYKNDNDTEIDLSKGQTIYAFVNSNSSYWNSTYTNFSTQSANNNSVYNTVNSNSATNWNYQGNDLKSLTGNWQNTYNSFASQSANNNSVFSTVQSNSSINWNYQGSDIKSLTANWQNTYTNFSVQSANNDSVYNTVNSNSATWGTGSGSVTGNYLPLSGGIITGNLSVVNSFSARDIKTTYVDFSPLSVAPTHVDGRLYYDSNERTLVFMDGDATLTYPINKMMWTIGVNKTASIIPKGSVVYLSGAQGNRGKMYPAIATNDYGSADTIGITMASTPINEEGYIMTIGELHGIDTRAYPEGTTLYLSPTAAGSFTHIKPQAPYHLVKVGFSLNSTVDGKIYVEIDNGYELNELHNVRINGVTNGQGLTYNSTSSLWINSDLYNGADLKSLSANWQNTYSTVQNTSSDWSSVYSTFNSQSANNNSVYNTVNSNSATNWNYQGSDIKALTANWQSTYTSFSTQSANNASVYSTVQSNSSTWSVGGGGADTEVRALTGNWQSTYTTVQTNSSTWGTGGGSFTVEDANTIIGLSIFL